MEKWGYKSATVSGWVWGPLWAVSLDTVLYVQLILSLLVISSPCHLLTSYLVITNLSFSWFFFVLLILLVVEEFTNSWRFCRYRRKIFSPASFLSVECFQCYVDEIRNYTLQFTWEILPWHASSSVGGWLLPWSLKVPGEWGADLIPARHFGIFRIWVL